VSFITSWLQRGHERGLARIEREYQRRADTYVEALTLVNHSMDWVNRTLPVITPAPPAPDPADEDTLRRASALVSLFGSAATLALMEELVVKQREFAVNVQMHASAKAAGRGFSAEDPGSWQEIMATREACRALQTPIEQAMRTDLARD
jgi:hypothetical protein